MKNFDQSRASRRLPEEARTFQIHGETFVMKQGIRPEAMTAFDELTVDSSVVATMAALDELFVEMVEDRDDAHGRYSAIRKDVEDPLTVEDLQEMVEWMIEQVTGRPTGSPSASTEGRGPTGTTSTDASSSPALQAA